MKKIRVKQVRSGIGRIEKQKRTLHALGLHKINQTNEIEASAAVLGMVEKVKHLIEVEEI